MTEGWIPDLARAGIKHQAIAEALGGAIERGALRAGERLPPQRELAARLGVDLTTVTKAYDAVRHRGLIEARGRAGSFVRGPQTVAPDELERADAGMNLPPELPGNLLARTIAASFTELLNGGSPLRLQYQPAGGAAEDRAAGARLLAQLGLPAAPGQVLVAAGGQNALHAILAATLEPGDAVACARYVYPGFRALAERLGIVLVPLPELTGDALRAACAAQPVKALYCVPTNDNPTTATLSPETRRGLAQAAEDCGLQVIEDDAYAPLAADPLPPIAALVPHRSWHVASTSKIVSPALRVAFVRAPDPPAAARLAPDLHRTAIMAPPLNVALVCHWIADGTYARLTGLMRREAVERQRLAREILAGIAFAAHPQGYHMWIPLTGAATPETIARRLRPTGLSAVPAERFAAAGGGEAALRVSLGGPIGPDRLAEGLRLLRTLAADPHTLPG
ncbi:MAG: PLP-dependent aminotransferase family protein [Novosphingobium sp.]|nr:PLP-dependent aminotransferase family protein [Novosphingobium sp.]MBO9603077.1 PLP-dependent aminotransferase family protein [Novosphingobium sp.]